MVSAELHMRSKRTSSVSSPRWTSHASNGPGMAPDSFRQSLTAARISGLRLADVTEQHVRMSVRRLGVGGHDDVGAQVERPLAVGSHGRVVCDDDGARLVGGGGDGGDVANVEIGVGGRFEQDKTVAFKAAIEKACRRAGVDRNAHRLQEPVGQHPRRVVAVGRQKDAIAGPQQAEQDCRDRSHAGRKGDGGGRLQMAEQLLDRVPGRVVETTILVEARRVAWKVVHRRHGQRQRHGIALLEPGAAQMGEARGARLRRFGHGRFMGASYLSGYLNEFAALTLRRRSGEGKRRTGSPWRP